MTNEPIVAFLPRHSVFDSDNIGNRTKCGSHRYKYAIRAAFRTVAFLSVISVFYVYNHFQSEDISDLATLPGRRLLVHDANNQDRLLNIYQDEADPKWLLAVYIILVLYLFLAIAIVCDEFFVPALEVMVDANHLNLSRDIAGATLMAAGGSAPELFTSIIGTFQRSDVGIGTIVGSAVFNVLFVIGMCSLCSHEVLQLSWWPLFRDCSYYVLGLVVLAIFLGVTTKGEVTWWEALILFALYFGYVLLMAFNKQVYKLVTGKELDEVAKDGDKDPKETVDLKYPHSFRAGLISFIRDNEAWQAKARMGFLYGISGDFEDVFDNVDSNKDGDIDRQEMESVFNGLGTPVNGPELDSIMEDIDEDGDGKVTRSEFKKWYVTSESQMKTKVEVVFKHFDSDKSGTLIKEEFICMLHKVDPTASQSYKDQAAEELFDTAGCTDLSFDQFTEWYFKSLIFTQPLENIVGEEENDGICDALKPPEDASAFDYVKYIVLLPIVASLAFTVPDVTRKGWENWCYASFILAICWIGVYSFLMVDAVQVIGDTIGIPSFIMGLTFLAAGTSVPDLLSSVIVARMGEGDMAVSSSIGSNIFDILVGLPFPWLLYIVWPNDYDIVEIQTNSIWKSIIILIAMILLIIVSIHLSGWKLTKTLGCVMFFFYFAFLLQEILFEYL